jgi:hypothetical protein
MQRIVLLVTSCQILCQFVITCSRIVNDMQKHNIQEYQPLG